jgi:hypothetical protein
VLNIAIIVVAAAIIVEWIVVQLTQATGDTGWARSGWPHSLVLGSRIALWVLLFALVLTAVARVIVNMSRRRELRK